MKRYFMTAALVFVAWMFLERNIALASVLLALAGIVLPKRAA